MTQLDRAGVAAVAVSYLNPSALSHARRLLRRLRLHFGQDVPMLLCLWSATPEAETPARATAETAADRVATSTAGALRELEDLRVLAPAPVKEEVKEETADKAAG